MATKNHDIEIAIVITFLITSAFYILFGQHIIEYDFEYYSEINNCSCNCTLKYPSMLRHKFKKEKIIFQEASFLELRDV